MQDAENLDSKRHLTFKSRWLKCSSSADNDEGEDEDKEEKSGNKSYKSNSKAAAQFLHMEVRLPDGYVMTVRIPATLRSNQSMRQKDKDGKSMPSFGKSVSIALHVPLEKVLDRIQNASLRDRARAAFMASLPPSSRSGDPEHGEYMCLRLHLAVYHCCVDEETSLHFFGLKPSELVIPYAKSVNDDAEFRVVLSVASCGEVSNESPSVSPSRSARALPFSFFFIFDLSNNRIPPSPFFFSFRWCVKRPVGSPRAPRAPSRGRSSLRTCPSTS
jgi:hypothetical protein